MQYFFDFLAILFFFGSIYGIALLAYGFGF